MLCEHEIANLLDNQEEFKLPEKLRKQLTLEHDSLLKKINLGMRDSKEGTEFAITESFFELLGLDFRTEFPLMFDMLHSFFQLMLVNTPGIKN